jgi:predicted neuraminidase
MLTVTIWIASAVFGAGAAAADNAPMYEEAFVFDPAQEDHGHVHASCVVECPNGDLRAVWYENGPALPPPYFSEQRDKSDDVRIGGSRKPKGADRWETPFVMADTFGVSDNNPCMVVDRENRLWLIHPTLLGVPENSWGSALVHYHVSSDYERPGPPKWLRESILVVHPQGFEQALMARFDERGQERPRSEEQRQAALERVRERLKDPLKVRLGWMPRAHPLVRSDGAVLVPLANENFYVAAMAMSSDGGATWTISEAVPGTGVSQPTVTEFPDGRMSAFFRNGRPEHRILRSDSEDGGMTWGPLRATTLPHLNAGIEAVLLRNGHLAMIYNDKEEDPRDRLAVSISADRGETWACTRHLEQTPGGRFDYPSLIQAQDGTLHATYSYNLKTVKHVHFNEAWVEQGDQ